MLEGLQQPIFQSVNFNDFFFNLIIALICGFLISLFYRASYQSPYYSATFVQAMVALSMVTALVIMVIGNNLARAFGLVGAMSIIRFRTAVKDTQDIVFIFFSLAAGMAAGVGLKLLALYGTVFIGLILLVLSRSNYARPKKKEFLVQFECKLTEGENPYVDIIDQYCKRSRLVNMQSLGEDENFEMSFHVQLREQNKRSDFIRELNRISQVRRVRFYFDEDSV